MNGYLLDTSICLRATADPDSLSRRVRRAIEQGPVFLSVLSFWEVVLKSTKGKLDVGDLHGWWRETLGQLAATPLLLRPEHISEISRLPLLHGDPFDRALIAQARVEALGFVTTGGAVGRYAGKSFQVVE